MTDVGMSNDDGKDARVEQLTRALLYALVSGVPDQPYPIPVPAARMIASLMDDCGVRQTDERAQEISLPGWVSQRVTETAQDPPTESDHFAPQPSPMIRKAPPRPAKIPKKLVGVVKT